MGDRSYGRAGQKRAEVIGFRCYKKVANEGTLVLLCNIMVMRSSSTRKPCTFPIGLCPCWPLSLHSMHSLTLPSLSSPLFFSPLHCLMSRGANFIKLLHCKSEINLSVHMKVAANKNTSRKRLKVAPDMTVMASRELQTIYRLSVGPVK